MRIHGSIRMLAAICLFASHRHLAIGQSGDWTRTVPQHRHITQTVGPMSSSTPLVYRVFDDDSQFRVEGPGVVGDEGFLLANGSHMSGEIRLVQGTEAEASTDQLGFTVNWQYVLIGSFLKLFINVQQRSNPGVRKDLGGEVKETRANTTHARHPVFHDTYNRGHSWSRVRASGSDWFPVRQDLDTMLSKIDSELVDELVAISGPYSALHGPGLAFYEFEYRHTPRFEGFETHSRTLTEYETNGQQLHGRTSLSGGNLKWGFRVGYGHRVGNDYETGDNTFLPTSYNSRTPDFALGWDPSDNQNIEFQYHRLDQTDVELPGQIFDFNFLATDAYELNYRWEPAQVLDQVRFEGWYNRTRFDGDNLRPGKRGQIPKLDEFRDSFLVTESFTLRSTTDAEASASGAQLDFTIGEPGDRFLTVGSDVRHRTQELNESNDVFRLVDGQPPPLQPEFEEDNPIEPAYSTNHGIYLEAASPLHDDTTRAKAGARVDWIQTDSRVTSDSRADRLKADFIEQSLSPNERDLVRNFRLWSTYAVLEHAVDQHWTMTLGSAHAMRPPTMTELYADRPFVAVLPQFVLTSVQGKTKLKSERKWQIDAGLRGEFSRVRFGVNGFYAWVFDYITLDYLDPNPAATADDLEPFGGSNMLTGGIQFRFTNTDRATLSGGEAYMELEMTENVLLFCQSSFVEGRDHSRRGNGNRVGQARSTAAPDAVTQEIFTMSSSAEEPLPAMPPWESFLGIRNCSGRIPV